MGWVVAFQRVTQTGQLVRSASFLERSVTLSWVRVRLHWLIISWVSAVENEFPRDRYTSLARWSRMIRAARAALPSTSEMSSVACWN